MWRVYAVHVGIRVCDHCRGVCIVEDVQCGGAGVCIVEDVQCGGAGMCIVEVCAL